MKKIRRGNDFVFAWEIERNGLPEDLSSVLEKHLYLSALGKRIELVEGVDYDITGNVVRIEVTPAIATILGTYKAEFHYILPDLGLIDEDRKCAVDVDAFVIVANTEQADNQSEFYITSDMAIAFKGDKGDKGDKGEKGDNGDKGDKGDKGDSFTYTDFTPEQIAELKQPAMDAAQQADTATTAAITAAGTANTAADNADNARLAIQDDLALKAAHGYVSPEIPKTLKDIEQKVDAGNLIIEYTHTGNKKVIVEGIDYDTNSFISTNHGLVDGDMIGVVLPQFQASSNPYQNNFPIGTPPNISSAVFGYFVVNSSTDKFSISQGNAGAQITLTSVTNFDFNSLWFERQTQRLSIEVLNPSICHRYVIYIEGFIMRPPRYVYITGDNNPSNNNVFGLYSYPHKTTNAIQYGFGVAPNDHYLGLCNYGVIEIVNGETGMMQKQYYNKTAINGTTHIPINIMLNSFGKIGNVTKFIIAEMFLSNGTKIRLYGE